jgi:hypothetical protein
LTRKDGASPELWEFMERADLASVPQFLREAFLRVNPDMLKLQTMHDKDAQRMRQFRDVPDESLKSMRAAC